MGELELISDCEQLKGLRQYGEMTTIQMGSFSWVMLNSQRVAHEIFNKRGAVTNDRPYMPVASGIFSRDLKSPLLSEADWAAHRHVQSFLLSGDALKVYAEFQELESTQMMAEYLFKPDQWFRHHGRFANSVIHRIVLGERLLKSSKELADLQTTSSRFQRGVGTSVPDWFPFIYKVVPKPLRFWEAYWEEQARFQDAVYKTWWDPVREKIDNGTAPPSFVRDSRLLKDSKFAGNEQAAMYISMFLIAGGSDTSRQVLSVIVMAALEYPEVFIRARAEVDRVCGPEGNARLPMIADMEQLSYICAMAKEALRWRPLFPVPAIRMLTRDTEFEGFRFPAGTVFALNGAALSDECENPRQFNPERWMDGYEGDITHGIWQFGGGRRLCVGYRLAQRNLFINIARLVQCVNFNSVCPLYQLCRVAKSNPAFNRMAIMILEFSIIISPPSHSL
jgi:cytochrome P450